MENKRIKAGTGKCKSCASEMKFNPRTVCLMCPSCGSVEDIEKNSDIEKHDASKSVDNAEYKEWIKQNKFLQCDSCGAKVVMGKYDITQTCPYCGSTFVVEISQLPGMKPDGIVPFEFDEVDASKRFRYEVKKKFFVPKQFKKELPASKIHGVYVPVFSFDADSKSSYTGWIEEDDVTYSDGRRRTYSRRISGNISFDHRNVLVESSTYLSDHELSEIQPFNLSKSFKFENGFVKGYSVEHYQETIDHCKNIARNKFQNQIRGAIKREYSFETITNLNIDSVYSNEKYAYHLLPIYNFEYEYKNKKRIAHMNGQTGKVGGDLPVSRGKVALVVGLGLLVLIGFGIFFFSMAGI